MFPGAGAVVVECAGHLVGVSRSGESRSDDLPALSAIYPLHHGLGTLNRELLAPSSDLACPCRITYRGAGDAGTRRRTRRTIPLSSASTGRGAASKLSAARVSRFTVERRRREQLPCAQPILGPAGARLGKRTATRHDGIGTSPRHRCSRRIGALGAPVTSGAVSFLLSTARSGSGCSRRTLDGC